MPLEPDGQDLIVDKLAMNGDFDASELAFAVREATGVPCTASEVENFIEQDSVQNRVETRRSYLEKNTEYTKKQLIKELIDAKETIIDIRDELRNENKSRSMVEAAGELRKTLELIGNTIDALESSEQGGNQYIRIDELSLDILVNALDDDDVEELVQRKNGLVVKRKS